MVTEKLRGLIQSARDMTNGSDTWKSVILQDLDEALEILKAEEARPSGVVAPQSHGKSSGAGAGPGRVVEVDFHVGQTVVFRLEPSMVGLVTSIHVRDGSVAYGVSWGDRSDSSHFAFELRPSEQPVLNYRD
jgi:hypothetical protein